MAERRILKLSGTDVGSFLQGLVTNDVDKLDHGLVYAALLTPQGKYIADFFLAKAPQGIWLDVAEPLADALTQKLMMYRLRSDVQIEAAEVFTHRGLGDVPEDGWEDPRHPNLGWRAYRSTPQSDDHVDWDEIRVAHCIPQSGIELSPDTFILEAGFEALNGVDFRKGCYVGQEVTARMKHKTELRKGLARVAIEGSAEVGSPIEAAGKAVGTLLTRSGNEAIAYLRFDRATAQLTAGTATLHKL